MIIFLAFIIGIAVLVGVGVRICVVVQREIQDDLERRRVAETVATARIRLRRLHHDAQREMYDTVIDARDE